MIHTNDVPMMERALRLARQALEAGEFPVGCVIVRGGEIIGQGMRMGSNGMRVNELDHAEIMAIRDCYEKVGGWPGRLGGLTCYTTLEPCLMCLGALLINGVKRIVFGFEDVMGGACGIDLSRRITWRSYEGAIHGLVMDYIYDGAEIEFEGGVLRDKCLGLFAEFYSSRASSYLDSTLLKEYTLRQIQ